VPADGQLRPGRSLTYRWSGRFGTEICVDKVEETVEAVMRVNGVTESTTVDNTATATSRVVPCLTDLAVTKTADREHAAVGDVVTWTVGVVNAGNTGVRISDITVTDPQLSDLAPVDPPAGSPFDGESSEERREAFAEAAERLRRSTPSRWI